MAREQRTEPPVLLRAGSSPHRLQQEEGTQGFTHRPTGAWKTRLRKVKLKNVLFVRFL